MFQRTFLTGLALTLFVIQACGSDDGKKHVNMSPEAGSGGEGGGQEPSAGGSASGAPDMGTAGIPMIEGGTGGMPAVEDGGGAGGAPVVIVPQPELLFTVKPGALGLAKTALSKQANAQNVIYTSNSGSQDAVDGNNGVKIIGTDLGLDAADQIVAFAIAQAVPKNPTFLFSIADGSEGGFGGPGTAVSRSLDTDDTEEGDIYFSEGTPQFRYVGEGGDQYGYNAMTATEVSLGLLPGDYTDPENPHAPDDLTGLAVHDGNDPITELYFTVSADAVGATDSAVSTVTAAERGCTVFKSGLDGKNSVAFSCSDLGLVEGDQIDALAVYGTTTPSDVIFSVTQSSQGAIGTAVNDAYLADGPLGATLFGSDGKSTNTLLKNASDLGLSNNYSTYNDVDGIAIIDTPPQARVVHAASCTPTYDPLDVDTGGALTGINGSAHIGNNVLVMFGQTATPTARLIAYNATDCTMLQQKDMPTGFESSYALTTVQLAGWSASKPLDKLAYYRLVTLNNVQQLQQFDDAGAPTGAATLTGNDYYYANGLVYEPASKKFYGVSSSSSTLRLAIIPLPAADATSVDPEYRWLTTPCNESAVISGTDSQGNLYLAQRQSTNLENKDYKVCTFNPNGDLQGIPYAWTSDTGGNSGGFVMPGGAHVLLHGSAAPVTIERGKLQAP